MSRKSELLSALRKEVNSYDNADSPEMGALQPVKGNPPFKAQFDVQFILKYFTVAAGVYTLRTAAYLLANHAALATQLPAFAFGQADSAAGFKKLQSLYPLQGGWAYDLPIIYGRDYAIPQLSGYGAFDATARAQFQVGDLLIPVWAVNAAVNVIGVCIVRCTQTAYGTILNDLSSDKFQINRLRYIMSDVTAVGLAQFNNQFSIVNLSLLGKTEQDYVDPTAFKQPDQQQDGIVDIPLDILIDKEKALSTFVNYDAVNVKWSVFVRNIMKS